MDSNAYAVGEVRRERTLRNADRSRACKGFPVRIHPTGQGMRRKRHLAQRLACSIKASRSADQNLTDISPGRIACVPEDRAREHSTARRLAVARAFDAASAAAAFAVLCSDSWCDLRDARWRCGTTVTVTVTTPTKGSVLMTFSVVRPFNVAMPVAKPVVRPVAGSTRTNVVSLVVHDHV